MKARDDAMEYMCGDGYDVKERLDEVERIFRTDERANIIKEIHTNFNILEPNKFREYLGQLWWNLEE